MEAILESQQQIQNLLNLQSFPNQTPYTPFLEHPIEEEYELEKRLELFCECNDFKICWTHHLN